MGINVDAQTRYWKDSAQSNLDTAEILLNKNKRLEGLFFCHLALEKALKAKVVGITQDLAPKTHNLMRLAELAEITLDDNMADFFGDMMMFHIEGRYPDSLIPTPDTEVCLEHLMRSREVVTWLAAL